MEERGGGCGALELSVVQAVTVFTFKREKIKDPKLKKEGRSHSLSSVWEASRYLQSVLMLSIVARHTFPILISSCPVEAKRALLQKHCFIKDST